MASPPKIQSVLVSWIGQADLNAAAGKPDVGLGPVAQAVKHRGYDRVVLLCDYHKRVGAAFLSWLDDHTEARIEVRPAKLTSPTNFGEIYEAVTTVVRDLLQSAEPPPRLTFHLSPGTPAMQAVWILVAKTRFAAELIESSKEHGVRTATIPFDIAAEFIPGVYGRLDPELERRARGEAAEAPEFDDIIHRGPVMKRVVHLARAVAPRSIPVLLEGESGTGKEMFARAIHKASSRGAKPFIAVNCGAIPKELADSELFGHKKGAFTGAVADRKGHFEAAQGGTIFLDEIGELEQALQVRLLRVLQERQVVPVGTSTPIPLDVRVIAATNRTLTAEIANGNFREDLFYRLAVGVIRLPPLRERQGDLNPLIDHLLKQINEETRPEPNWQERKLSVAARNLLLGHPWPGNVRELENTLKRLAVWSSDATITEQDVRESLLAGPPPGHADGILNRPLEGSIDIQALLDQVTVHYLKRAMEEAHGNKTRAAELLKLRSYQVLSNWLKKYGVSE